MKTNIVYDLMFCCLGNGITVVNRKQMEHGDYKIIAHISERGKIEWYVKECRLPNEVIAAIREHALPA
jgi:hypothetical protein